METDASGLDMKGMERIGHFCLLVFFGNFVGGRGCGFIYNKVGLIEI